MKKVIKYIIFRLLKPFIFKRVIIKSNISLKLKIGEGSVISERCIINPMCSIGCNVFIGDGTRIEFVKSIGSYSSISHGVKLGVGPHPHNWISTSPIFYSPHRGVVKLKKYSEIEDKGLAIIENDVLIGANAIILAGVHIHIGAIIGAGSVVTKDIPPFAIVAGNPAMIIKYRFDEDTRTKILNSKWWEKDIKDIELVIEYANNPLSFIEKLNKL